MSNGRNSPSPASFASGSGGGVGSVRSLRSTSRSDNQERNVTTKDLQDLLRSIETIFQAKNEIILTRINELENKLRLNEMKKCPCGLNQTQLDLYKWVDRETGKCLARYLSPDGRELICEQLYTTHEQLTPPKFTNNVQFSGEDMTKSSSSSSSPASAPPPPPQPQPHPAAVSQAVKSEAAARIQRLASRRRAWKTAEAEREWKIFNDLDTQDEADMLNLAAFMQTLLNWVPSSESSKTKKINLPNQTTGTKELTRRLSSEFNEDDDDEENNNNEDNEESSLGGTGKVNLDHIHLSIGDHSISNEDLTNFHLPRGPVTSEMAKNIVTLYRRKGKLSHKSLQRILREVYTPLKQSPNISYIEIGREEKITVVGDLHGQLGDLFYILDESGFPSPSNKYLFNGDFVDRGQQGIEVMVVILALYSAFPNCVYLNRGNHEDESICRVYGFEKECREKYDDLIFGMFSEVFRHLPLVSIINSSIFIIHGGLFHQNNVTIADLEQIDRTDYIAKPTIPYPECLEGLNDNEVHLEFLKQLQRDLLWSDPSPDEYGIVRNQRGAGVRFGSDIVEKFLENNNLKMIIRSHECVRKGFDLPFNGSAKNLLGTLFSASNYSGGHNDGAYLIFTTHRMNKSSSVNGCEMFYTVHKYKTSDAKKSLIEVNKLSLKELIIRKRKALLQAFELADRDCCGEITKINCVEIMQNVTQLKIFWLSTINNLVPSCVNGNMIKYYEFLNSFSLKSIESPNSHSLTSNSGMTSGATATAGSSSPSTAARLAGGTSSPSSSSSKYDDQLLTIDSLYGQRTKLEAVFRFFDTNGDGSISREEFHRGCDIINMTLPSDQQLKDYDHVLNLMDFDHSDSIDLNEFFEVFRILDAKDGVVDGVISLAPQSKIF